MFTDLKPIDRVLEQCAWVCTNTKQTKRMLCFNTKTGVFIYDEIKVGKPFHHKNIVVDGTAEEIYTKYLDMIELPKEKAFLNNKHNSLFRVHHLIQGVFNELNDTIMKNIESTHPEYLI